MNRRVRHATEADLAALSELCMRSKAHWGYNAEFMEACRSELTLTPRDLETTSVALCDGARGPAAMAQVGAEYGVCDLGKLFVVPEQIAEGLGRLMFEWAVAEGLRLSCTMMRIDSDPGAEAFYLRMGAKRAGMVQSGSIPGRMLPLLHFDLA